MQQARHSNACISIRSRCRTWRQTQLRCSLEVSLADEWDDEGVARIIDIADANLREIEADMIANADAMTVADAVSLLALVQWLAKLERDEDTRRNRDRADALLSALQRGLTGLVEAPCDRRAA